MRPNEERKSTRVAVAPYQTRLRPNLTPTTLISTKSSAGSKAAALSVALGITSEINETLTDKRNERETSRGIRDFETGQVDEERAAKFDSYSKAVTQLRARSKWTTDKAEIDEFLRSQDTDNMSPEELNATLDEQFKLRYEGLDDEDQAEVLLPRIQEFRASKLEQYVERQKEIVDTANQADLTNVAEDVYKQEAEKVLAVDPYASVTFDYNGLHTQMRAELQYTGKESNEIYFKILSDIAIRNGDPDIIRNLPDNWEDGTPSIRNIPEYNEKLLNSEQRAESVRASNENKEAKHLKNSNDQAKKDAENALFLQAIDGVDPTAFGKTLVKQGFIDGKTLNQITGAYRSSRDDSRKQSADDAGVAKIRALIQTVPDAYEPADLYIAWSEGTFGTPDSPEAVALFKTSLSDLANAKQTRSKVLSDPRIVTYRNQFKALNKPLPNAATGQVDRTINGIYANNLGAMERELAANPDEATKIYSEWAGKTEQEIESYNKSRYVNNISTPEDLTTGLSEGRISVDDFIAKQGSVGITTQALKRMQENNQISEENYRQILQAKLKNN